MKEETVLLCGECLTGELNTSWVGDEGWTVCPECQSVEGNHYELTIEELEQFETMDLETKSQKLRELSEEMLLSIKRIKL